MDTSRHETTCNLPLRPLLAFTDSGFETRFVDNYRDAYYRYAQFNIAVGMILVFGDFLADRLAFPGQAANIWRLLLCEPILFMGLAVSFTPQARRHWQTLMSGFLVACALSLILVLMAIDREGGFGLKSWVGLIDFLSLELFCFVILGLQFRFALISGVLILLAFETTIWLTVTKDVRHFSYLSYHVLSIFLGPALIGWWREFVLRKEFLTRSELESARQTAVHLTDMKSELLATMSHEIRTPMNAIIGMSGLALQMDLAPKQRNYIEKVNRSAEHLLGLINQVLDFSKAEAGRLVIEEESFSLEDVMDNLANMIAAKAEEKGLDFLFDFAPDIPTALAGDKLRLGQILLNLVGNAIKFTANGEVIVGAAPLSRTETGAVLHFWVKDSGIGMTADQQSRLFQAYSQADSTTTRMYGGTGLGLAISKQLVELMGGRIWVESEFGKGSAVHFTARFALPAAPVSRRQACLIELAGKRLLVVDDNAAAREILLTMARSFGLEAESAWDGHQALASIEANDRQANPFDLVLIDWRMPRMDGLECIRLLQLAELTKPPALVMVTAESHREDALMAAQKHNAMLKSVLAKPISPSTLLEALNHAIGHYGPETSHSFQPPARQSNAMRRLEGARLLLVEDNALNQELAIELLTQAGITVVIANNGLEALNMLAADHRFDGILMDCQMPLMDGFTATREIRAKPEFAHIPIIAMTANAMAADRENVLAAGMVDHIAKPFDVTKMFETIANWITPSQPASIAPVATVAPAPLVFELPGIDTKAGLAITMNNQELYLNLLRKFHASEADFGGAFRRAQQDKDPSAAARAAHTLKGSAANIGAKEVQAAAAALEEGCLAAAPAAVVETLLEETLSALGTVIEALGRLERRKTSSLAANGTGKQMVRPLLARLIALLEDNNLEAGDVVQELAACVQNTPLAGLVEEAGEAVASFDVDLALSLLGTMADKMKAES